MLAEALKDWFGAIGGLIGVCSIFYTWVTSRAAANATTLEKMGDEVTTLTRRVDHIDTELQHLPDKDTVHKMEVSMAEIRGEIGQMTEASKATQRTVQRIENHLLGSGK